MTTVRFPQVVHVTTAHLALDSRIFYKEARPLAKAGFRIAVVGRHAEGSETVDGVEVIPLKIPQSRLIRRIVAPWSALKLAVATRAPIIHFHDPEFIPAGFVAKLFGRKVIYDVHEYYSEVQALRAPTSFGVRPLVRFLLSIGVEQVPARIFDGIVFPTNRLRNAIHSGRGSIAVLNVLSLDAIPDHLAEPETPPDHDIVFVGSMSPFRAGPFLQMVAHILDRHPDSRALLLGVPEATKRWMMDNCQSDKVRSALTFHPRVPVVEVPAVLRRAKVGFNYHPMERRFEVAIPVKVYEYIAAGLPVVTTRFPELADQFQDGQGCIFVDGDDMQAYADSVCQLLACPKERRVVAQFGLERMRAEINFEGASLPPLRNMLASLGVRPVNAGSDA